MNKNVSESFFGNLEGDAVRLEVDEGPGAWLAAFNDAIQMIENTLQALSSAG